MFDEDIDAEKEKAFNEFTKEYGQREEDWTIYDDWITGMTFFVKLRPIGTQKRSSIGERKYLSDLYIVCPV